MEDDRVFDEKIYDIGPRKRKTWRYVILALIALLFLYGTEFLGIYIDSLWFASLGYSDVYWYKFRLGGLLFLTFLVATFLLIRLPFVALNKALPQLTERPRVRPASMEDLKEINFLPLIYRPGVWIISALVAFLFAVSMSQSWPAFALYLNSSGANYADPIFNKDVSFYMFRLPVLSLISGWLVTITLLLFVIIAGASAYVWYIERVLSFGSTSTGRKAAAAASIAGAFFALALAFSTYLARFDLLDSQHALFTGVSYADANYRLPGMMVLIGALVLTAIVLIVNAFVMRKWRFLAYTAGLVVAVWAVAILIIPQSLQSLSVKPNELAKEEGYITHNISMTRRAFALDRFQEKAFQPALTISSDQIQTNRKTIDNIRLWDPRVLQSTFSQFQAIRQYYEFREPDIDRYMLNGELRQVMIAAREMNVQQLEAQSRNWINQHLIYTHGYGLTMSTVNEITPEGSPRLLLKNMPVESEVPEIKVTRPEIYFGESTNQHVYVGTKQPEFDYPATGETVNYNAYEGRAGIPVGGTLRKTAFALYLGDGTSLLLSDYIDSDSRVLIRRNVQERVRQVAPFLMYDDNPYVVVDGEGRLFWMIDAFTYSDHFPYSTSYNVSNRNVNYIRNSVKAVVDAYNGDVTFYIFEPDDPIIRSYQNIFPSLFRPSEEMPADLRAHVRYPDLLVDAQARAYTLYHMQNPQTFYNREDMWSIPTVDPGADQDAKPTLMEPYYVLLQLRLEGSDELELVSILPFTPAGPGRNNMIGWLAARSDKDRYGQTLVYTFPKNLAIGGPAQIRARVNQDPQLSQLMSLWDQRGSRLLRGNLLVIPIGDSLLYIESFYLAAANSQIPELRQVAVATQDRLATGRTLEEALRGLFGETGTQPPPEGEQQASQTRVGQLTPPPQAPPAQGAQPGAPPQGDFERLAQQAQQLLTDYERLSAQGKHAEAGQKLDQLKQTLNELSRRRSGG
ncbi:MAG TPA: UPF0182 family protein [Blastocatellia bacterium]|nr:UPF0182 family protein [Blastocatellia bacterium]